ncbi:MAG: hypothetical protein HY706_16815 [Candidatus Hydrogenedentes bacterium]|nr:hypothetical protein [Candidatus Hydrogenedentota bacterium]
MPYYPKLQQLLTDVSHWADLRTEQGSQVLGRHLKRCTLQEGIPSEWPS